jgi:hypothetical protein
MLLNREFWTDRTLRHKSGSRRNFSMITPETLNTEVVANELRFPLVTRTVSSDARFDSYELLKSDHGAEWFWTDWTYEWISQAWGIRSVNLGESYVRIM